MDEYEYEARIDIVELVTSFQAGSANMRRLMYKLSAYASDLSNVPDLGPMLSPLLSISSDDILSIPADDQEKNWSSSAWAKNKKRESEFLDFFGAYLEQNGNALKEAAEIGL